VSTHDPAGTGTDTPLDTSDDMTKLAPTGRQHGTRLPTRSPAGTGSRRGSGAAGPSPATAAPEYAHHRSHRTSTGHDRHRLASLVSWFDPSNLVAWLFLALLGLGMVLTITQLVRPELVVSTPAVLFSIVFWSLFAIPWLVFISHRELFSRLTRRTAVVGFLWGGFIATFVISMPAEIAFQDTLAKLFGPDLVATWGAGLTAGWIEEIACGIGIVAVLMVMRQRLRSPFEMMVLGMFVGFGFQVVEDFEYMLHGLNMTFGQNVFESVFQSFVGRVVMASWWSHQLFTGLFGAGLGYLMSRDTKRKPAVAIGLMLAAIVGHSFWDSPLLSHVGGPLVSAFLKGAILLAFFVWVYRRAASDERDWVVEVLDDEVAAGVTTAEDVESLAPSYHRRRRAWHHLHHEHGAAAVEAEKAYQSALIVLADDLCDARAGESLPTVAQLDADRDEVERLRAARDAALEPATAR
jgi:RsiW-degrading membrane proteinase PrsW (M82 family)